MIHNTINAVSVNSLTDKSSTNLIFSGGRQTGSIRGDTYYRTLKPNHFLKYPELSIAVSVDVLDQLHDRNIETLEFRHSETGTKYRCSLEHFLECGSKLDRGYGKQVALPLSEFTIEAKNSPMGKTTPIGVTLPTKTQEQPANSVMQLSFGGWR